MSSKKKHRSQFISYQLLDKSKLDPNERSVLSLVMTRPHFYFEKLANMGIKIKRSARTVQRAIKSLIEKGLLIKKYTTGKIMLLSLPSLKTQEMIAKEGPIAGLFSSMFRKRRQDKAVVSDTTPVSQPINSENKTISILKSQDKNLRKSFNIEQERQKVLRMAANSPIYKGCFN